MLLTFRSQSNPWTCLIKLASAPLQMLDMYFGLILLPLMACCSLLPT